MNYTLINNCPITGDTEGHRYFNLGNIPLVNNLCNSREESINAERYALDLNYYVKSKLSTLSISIDGDILFVDYLFKSSVNVPYIEHCKNMYRAITKYVTITNQSRIYDIGGNDGTLLAAFNDSANCILNSVNIDPASNLATYNKEKHITMLNEFFTLGLAMNLPKASVITSTNVFQHLKDINSFVRGIECMLEPDGIWVLEFPYWITDMDTNQFDQVYHEHVYYYSVTPLKLLMELHGLKIVNVSKQEIHGGTLRLVISKKESKHIPDASIESYIQSEKEYDLAYHFNWGKKVQTHITDSKKCIEKLKQQGKTIYGFGAAAKGCIYLNAMGIDYKTIDYIIDDTDVKRGKFVPGTGIEIVSREILKSSSPDYILILAHNFADYIIKSLKLEYTGKYIILIPSIKELN